MPVVSATPVNVIRRCARTRFSRGPTSSSASGMAEFVSPASGVGSMGQSDSGFPETATIVGQGRASLQPGGMSQYDITRYDATQFDVAVIGGGPGRLSAAPGLCPGRGRGL